MSNYKVTQIYRDDKSTVTKNKAEAIEKKKKHERRI